MDNRHQVHLDARSTRLVPHTRIPWEQPCNAAEEGEQDQEAEERKVHAVSTAYEVGIGGEPRQQEEHNADEERSCTGKKKALSKTVRHDASPKH